MSSYAKSTEPRRRALRSLLLSLGYGRLNVEAVVAWTEAHDGDPSFLSPHVLQHHRGVVASLLMQHDDSPAPAEFWGPETDAERWVPTEAASVEGGVLCASR